MMHSECKNLLELCKMKYVYVNDGKGELAFLENLENLDSFTKIFIQVSDEAGAVYRVSMKYCIDCGKQLLREEKII